MLHSIIGLQNSGKTLLMTYLLFMDFIRGRTIISNYNLFFPHYKINKDYLLDIVEKGIVIKNASFGFDELWIWLDSRTAINNTVATYFFLQSSKTSSNIYSSAQTNTQNDKRFRDNLHKITQCGRTILHENKFQPVERFITPEMDERFLTPELQKLLYIECQEYKRVNMGFYTDIMKSNSYYLPAQPMFNLFDTTEKIRVPK